MPSSCGTLIATGFGPGRFAMGTERWGRPRKRHACFGPGRFAMGTELLVCFGNFFWEFRTWAFCHGYRTEEAEYQTETRFGPGRFAMGTEQPAAYTPPAESFGPGRFAMGTELAWVRALPLSLFRTWAFCHGYRTSPSTNNYHLLFRTWIFLPWVSN